MGWLRGQDGCPCQSFDLPELLAEETEARAHILRSLVGLVTLLTPGGLGPVLADVGEAQASFLLSLLFKQGDQWRRTQLTARAYTSEGPSTGFPVAVLLRKPPPTSTQKPPAPSTLRALGRPPLSVCQPTGQHAAPGSNQAWLPFLEVWPG